jgi:hypothetical protein
MIDRSLALPGFGLEHDATAYCGSAITCAAELSFRWCRKMKTTQPPAVERRQPLVKNHAHSHMITLLHTSMHWNTCTGQLDRTQLKSQTGIRLSVDLSFFPDRLATKVQYEYITSPLSDAAQVHACTIVQ